MLVCHHTLVSAELSENHKCKQNKVKQKWLELLLNNDIDPENKNKKKMPSWSAFNSVVFKETLSQKNSRVLPIIPSPVTDNQRVYTALKNFQDILNQLSQTHLVVTYDEGVYHIAREITMGNATEFENTVVCLRTFHMTKIFLGCLGKYLQNNGAESIWIENSVFGPNVVSPVCTWWDTLCKVFQRYGFVV